jgi:ribosome-binding factor A
MPTRRQERVSKRITQELVEATRDLKNSAELGFLTFTRCEVSQDLRHAKVFISVFGKEGEQDRTLALLRRDANKLKTMIARPLGTKTVPSLHFEIDDTVANADMMNRLIKDARATDANQEPMSEEEAAAFAAARLGKTFAPAGVSPEGVDPFDAARMDVEEEVLGEDDASDFGDDDPDWKPVNLDELPDDDE